MNDRLEIAIDAVVPRGGTAPLCLHITLEEYLCRLAYLKRKVWGLDYRLQQWNAVCIEYKKKWDQLDLQKMADSAFSNGKVTNFSYTTRDSKLENEFEMILYSISTTLSSLTRVVASFLQGRTNDHSHSKLQFSLAKYPEFSALQTIVADQFNAWGEELKARRDAATHYIMLSVSSSFIQDKKEGILNIVEVGITKEPIKHGSIWHDILPVWGDSITKSVMGQDIEEHEMFDAQKRLIIQRNKKLPKAPLMIDGEYYIQTIYENYCDYLVKVLELLKAVMMG
jgi:hypothetical protein